MEGRAFVILYIYMYMYRTPCSYCFLFLAFQKYLRYVIKSFCKNKNQHSTKKSIFCKTTLSSSLKHYNYYKNKTNKQQSPVWNVVGCCCLCECGCVNFLLEIILPLVIIISLRSCSCRFCWCCCLSLLYRTQKGRINWSNFSCQKRMHTK